ncbi:D-hexose-6-phosphate mutarotase [Metapseudomonas resinovorans]|uniref:Putative glucose-6-phosphate 1-epimerase n=1 Tax=Metapseudomonas resinovorans NBRC 106553 TaxID=1245471 RepID=S6B276_METRE|nr:D-hexose-6-phosphate mutarotase [Pseudomonas resinovorans]BAN51311.1 putative aldose 1-epimerase [Pseudomonas resinovorans NBRC 106553]
MYDDTLPTVEQLVVDELVCWRVHTRHAELLMTQQGAQVLSYQPHGEEPVIWLSGQAAYQKGKAVRGGVPVCWPWFGDLRRNPAEVQGMHQGGPIAPAHGLVRELDWQLLGIDSEGSAVRLEFAVDSAAEPLPGWPHAAQLKLSILLDESLQLTLSSRNTSDRPLALSQALHSYFAVSDIREVEVEGLDGCSYIETLEDWQQRNQQGNLRFSGETDRIYLATRQRMAILDRAWNRRIELEARGSASAVVWNPWIDKARRLSQFADDAWQGMLCIETARVLDDLLVLRPDEEHSMVLSVASKPL